MHRQHSQLVKLVVPIEEHVNRDYQLGIFEVQPAAHPSVLAVHVGSSVIKLVVCDVQYVKEVHVGST